LQKIKIQNPNFFSKYIAIFKQWLATLKIPKNSLAVSAAI
jgi:hypothetical protein